MEKRIFRGSFTAIRFSPARKNSFAPLVSLGTQKTKRQRSSSWELGSALFCRRIPGARLEGGRFSLEGSIRR
ncbi:MAG: hypothetical protein ABH891_05620 [Candidatus Omnitrophota bacterium]